MQQLFLFQNKGSIYLPVTAPSKELGELLEVLFIDLVKPVKVRTVNINNGHDLPRIPFPHNDGDHNLALAVSVTGDVAGELLDVRDELRSLG
ncbi:hypothetical protein ANO14919_093030 [Xylariales sp. No.14919]|nr:hypothetical protein ANO14919_093030 [Xylariales sp. No.14919]